MPSVEASHPKLTSLTTATLSLLLERQRLQSTHPTLHLTQIVVNLRTLRSGVIALQDASGPGTGRLGDADGDEGIAALWGQYERLRGMLGEEEADKAGLERCVCCFYSLHPFIRLGIGISFACLLTCILSFLLASRCPRYPPRRYLPRQNSNVSGALSLCLNHIRTNRATRWIVTKVGYCCSNDRLYKVRNPVYYLTIPPRFVRSCFVFVGERFQFQNMQCTHTTTLPFFFPFLPRENRSRHASRSTVVVCLPTASFIASD